MNRLLRKERRVYLGGVRLWPLQTRIFGQWYTIGPMPLYRFHQFIASSKTALGILAKGESASSFSVFQPLVRLLVSEPMRERDERNMTPAQLDRAFNAFALCNDLPYLYATQDSEAITTEQARLEAEGFTTDDSPEWLSSVEWNWVDMLDSVQESRPQYDLDRLKVMPATQFYALRDAIAKKTRIRKRLLEDNQPGRETGDTIPSCPEFDHPPTIDEMNAASARIGSHG